MNNDTEAEDSAMALPEPTYRQAETVYINHNLFKTLFVITPFLI